MEATYNPPQLCSWTHLARKLAQQDRILAPLVAIMATLMTEALCILRSVAAALMG